MNVRCPLQFQRVCVTSQVALHKRFLESTSLRRSAKVKLKTTSAQVYQVFQEVGKDYQMTASVLFEENVEI